jgi:hypothetical protein
MTTSYLAATGTVSTSVTGTSASDFVYPVASTSSSLPSAVTALEYSTGITTTTTGTNIGTLQTPSWSPVQYSAGSVTTAGDLALIDAGAAPNGVNVTVYVTNLAALQEDYSSFALPIGVYSYVPPSGSGSTPSWTLDTAVVGGTIATATYLTSTSGYLTFNLPSSTAYYDITIDSGGSYYCTSTTAGSLAPTFFITAQPY